MNPIGSNTIHYYTPPKECEMQDCKTLESNENCIYFSSSEITYKDLSGTYIGQHLNGFPHGPGKFIYNDESIYSGEWKKGYQHGVGIYQNKEGKVVFEGEFFKGFFVSVGKFKYADNSCYSGRYYLKNSDPICHGYGRMNYCDGSAYEGEFIHGVRQGEGIMWMDNEKEYIGKWKNNVPDGYGRLYDEESYEGEWKEGKMHGIGTYYFSDGTELHGIWKNNQLESETSERVEIKTSEKKIQLKDVTNFNNETNLTKSKLSINQGQNSNFMA